MKKLKLLIAITLLISIHSLGQSTVNSITKDTVVKLPINAAKAVAKDVLRKDSCEKELDITKTNLTLEKNNSKEKDKIITSKDQEIGAYRQKEINYNLIIDNRNKELTLERQTTFQLAKDLKQTKRRKTRNDIFLSAVIGVLGYMFITK